MKYCEYINGVCVSCGHTTTVHALRRECGNLPAPPATHAVARAVGRGPGTELKRLLAGFGITATPDCLCNARADEMDDRELASPGWCEENIGTIVGWLRQEAGRRGLPFIDAAGRLLVRKAIARAAGSAGGIGEERG